jgi:alpha-D-ribose 1-methylphosphonate 5-triphosphate diphosphatase
MRALRITGAKALLDHGLEDVAVLARDGRIAEIGGPARPDARDLDASGLILAPALVDIHGDAFERQVSPRPGVFAPPEVAVLDTDRQLAAAGIATAGHALTLSWEPGLRSVAQARAFLGALEASAPRLSVEHRMQLRWEVFALEAEAFLLEALQAPLTPSLAFNDHTSMNQRAFDVPQTARAFEFSDAFVAADPGDPRLPARIAGSAKRAGLSQDDYLALQARIWARRPEVPAAVERVAAAARAAGAPMLSHDDTQQETRDWYRARGARIAEFPMQEAIARDARAQGEAVVLGAPNVMRGGSHIGSLDAAEMVEAGVCDVLASDYHYPAMLAAMGRLAAERRAPLPDLWSCVSAGPARALGLTDRGRISEGLRADLTAVEWPAGGTPAARLTLSAGRPAFLSGDLLA